MAERLGKLQQAGETLTGIFVYRDQWSPNANFHYGQFMKRMADIKKAKEEGATEEDRNRRTQELLARMGATKDSVVLPVPPAACADIARCAVFPRTHNPSPLARLLRRIFIESQKASVKTGVIQNRLIQKKSPPSRLE